MFDFVRSHNRLLQIALGVLIIPAFGIFGVQSYTSMNSEQSQAVASVDGRDISRADWDLQHRKDIETLRQRSPDIDPKLLDSPQAQRASLDSLVRERVVQTAVTREGLTPSNEFILKDYQTNDQYASIRALPKQVRDLRGAEIYQSIGSELGARQALQGAAVAGFVPASSLKVALDAFFDQRDIQWQHFDTKDYAAAIQPTDAQIDAYYKAHTAQFVAPEQARIEYLVLDALNLQPQAKVLPEEIEQSYKQNAAQYTAPEERSASYILTKVAPGAAPADVAKAKAQADSQLAELRKNPAAFADEVKKIAANPGGPVDAGDLDFMRKGALGQPALDAALFTLKSGEVSDVVRIDGGFQIIKVTGVRGGVVKPFDEVKAQVEDQLKLQAAQKLFQADAEGFTNTVYEKPESLDPAATAYKLTKQTATVQRQASPGAAGPLASGKLLSAIFATDAIKAKHNTEAVESAPGQLVSAHVLEYTPQHTRPLAEVREQVEAAVRQEQATLAAKKDGEARVAAAKADANLALPQAATASRDDRSGTLPQQVVMAALKADLSKGPTVVGVALPDGGYAAIRVLKSSAKVPQQGVKEAFTGAFEDAEAQAVYDSLKSRYKVKYEEDRIAHVTAQPASAPN